MKANGAPEKIYLTPLECMAASCQPQKDNTVEYTRTDAFIEKAIAWIDYNNRNGGCNFEGWEKDFKKYMEE